VFRVLFCFQATSNAEDLIYNQRQGYIDREWVGCGYEAFCWDRGRFGSEYTVNAGVMKDLFRGGKMFKTGKTITATQIWLSVKSTCLKRTQFPWLTWPFFWQRYVPNLFRMLVVMNFHRNLTWTNPIAEKISTFQPVMALNKIEDDYVGQLLAQNLYFDTCIKDLNFYQAIYSNC